MAISSLAKVKIMSPNHSGKRKKKIIGFALHCFASNSSIESVGRLFAQRSRAASSQYGVGSDGRIACYCDEANRAWTTSSDNIDQQVITIEIANDKGAPDWHMSTKAIDATVKLMVDCCKRNGIKQVSWKANKATGLNATTQNIVVHRWYAQKACPGDYLYKNMQKLIVDPVNAVLKGTPAPKPAPKPEVKPGSKFPYKVKVTAKDGLRVRKGASTNYAVSAPALKNGTIVSIIAEKDGWGQLSTKKGWISLVYAKRI